MDATPETQLVEHLCLIERILAAVCRRNGFPSDESEEFAAWAKLRLVEDDYGILRKFEGRSSLATYLTTVIANLFRDYRIHRWGKWRPSAEAIRLGPVAVRYETLVHRDGRSFADALEMLQREQEGADRVEIEGLAAKLPQRPRRRLESDDCLEEMPALDSSDRGAADSELRSTQARVESTLAESLATLAPEARLVLKLRFFDGLSVVEIARMTGQEPRPLYSLIERALRSVRGALVASGLDATQVLDLVGWPALDLTVDFDSAEVDSTRRSSNRMELRS
jgi:RNA polymerase sigma factor for flagellar operon FliA